MDGTPASPSSSNSEALDGLIEEFGAEALDLARDGIPALRVARSRWADLAQELRDRPDLSYEMLVSITAVDEYGREERFDVVAHLWSLRYNRMLRVKVAIPEGEACPSVTPVWSGANWQEREVFDMFGISFDGHPDLRRILMPDDYPFHPLRKDFPMEGIDNSVSYRAAGGTLMTEDLAVNRPAGQDPTPADLSHGDPDGFTDRAEEI